MNNNGSTALGLILGAAIGAALGVLYAPDKGVKTRERLSEEALSARDRLTKLRLRFHPQKSRKRRRNNRISSRKQILKSELRSEKLSRGVAKYGGRRRKLHLLAAEGKTQRRRRDFYVFPK